MSIPLLVGTIVIWILMACFSFVLLFGAPFLPTLKPQIESALALLDLRPDQVMLELGCGDGRVLIAAAERGICGIGYELNPILAFIAWLRTRRFKGKVKVYCVDYWRMVSSHSYSHDI
jgi:SAM-dependent methyltransferase